MEEILDVYGPIEPPSQKDRRIHLGIKEPASVTKVGVKVFNLHYNSEALQKLVDPAASKKVTVHLDPDDLREVTITAEGRTEELTVPLSLTALNDLTLLEAQEVMKSAVERNPGKRLLNESHLFEARTRRAKESGFFASPLVPDSYYGTERARAEAAKLLRVEFAPPGPSAPTVPPSGIMDRSGHPAVHQVTGNPHDKGVHRSPSAQTFAKIKDSKL